jgi:2-(3-amino-3-carboxypropyl)histidine synthase
MFYPQIRTSAVERVKNSYLSSCLIDDKTFVIGIILGTLGRQGSVGIVEALMDLLESMKIKHMLILISEISQHLLSNFDRVSDDETSAKNTGAHGCVDAWVQVACPRLSLDWGHHYRQPLLSSYEAMNLFSSLASSGKMAESTSACCGSGSCCSQEPRIVFETMPRHHPMDYYSNEGGPWSNYACKKITQKTSGSVLGFSGSQSTKFWHMGSKGRAFLNKVKGQHDNNNVNT